ncbi:hypothetical protein F4779DRAFT_609437 [Xylariaceae sp. FL0662B]|nr:hypothetical protein F4779DRAFT_609437 [Xylariaceae sp. FL0662B]
MRSSTLFISLSLVSIATPLAVSPSYGRDNTISKRWKGRMTPADASWILCLANYRNQNGLYAWWPEQFDAGVRFCETQYSPVQGYREAKGRYEKQYVNNKRFPNFGDVDEAVKVLG